MADTTFTTTPHNVPLTDERAAFEAWLDFDEDQMQMLAGRDESGDYLHATIAIQWEAWQAATAAEREMAAKVCESFLKYAVPDDYDQAAVDCAAAIRARAAPIEGGLGRGGK